MFNWQDDKSRLNSLVALNYNSGNGLKVNDVASNVGQGWNLVAGGVITRMQVGEPDDQPAFLGTSGTGKSEDITKYPAGSLYATVPAELGCLKTPWRDILFTVIKASSIHSIIQQGRIGNWTIFLSNSMVRQECSF